LLFAFASAGLASGNNASAAPRLAAAQYRAKATHVCQGAKNALNAIPQSSFGDDLAPVRRRAVAIEDVEIRQLQLLIPPKSLAALVQQGMANKRKELAAFTKLLADAHGRSPSLEQVLAFLAPLPDDAALWTKIGAPICQW
jgi:hypothetical protein